MKTLIIILAVALCLCNSQAVPGGYSQVPSSEVQNSTVIQSLAQSSVNTIVQLVLSNGNLPNSDTNFKLTNINSVYQQVVNGINYRLNVTLTNADNGIIIIGIYTVNYQPTTKAQQPVSASYTIVPHVAIPTTAPSTASSQQTGAKSTATTTPVPTTATTTPTTTTTTAPTTTTAAPSSTSQSTSASAAPIQTVSGGYTPLSADEIKNNPTVQSLAAYGAQNITQQAIADGKAPANSVFTVTNINSVSAQVVNGINYSFNVNLSNADKSINLVAAYIIFYQSWTNTTKVLATSFVVAPK